MEVISQVGTHAGQNRELCLSAHGRLLGTLYGIIIPALTKIIKIHVAMQMTIITTIATTGMTMPVRGTASVSGSFKSEPKRKKKCIIS